MKASALSQSAWGIRSPCRDSASVAVDGGQTYPLRGISEYHRPAGLGARAMRPVAEWRSESAKRQGAAPDPRAARPVAERRPWGRKRREREAIRRTFPKRHTYLYSPARPRRAVRGAGGHPLPVYWLRGWRAMVSSMICLRSSSLMPARISLMESIRGLPLARPTAIVVSPSATVKPSPSSKDR